MTVAVVTGSSSGIGRATAIELARRGYSLVLHARANLRGLHATADQIRGCGHPVDVLCITADIASPSACRDLVAAAFGWRGFVDAWVNNAGADVLTGEGQLQPFHARLERMMQVDVMGTARVSRLVVRHIDQCRAERYGTPSERLPTIINVGWDQATPGMEGDAGQLFCTAKSAVAAFSRSLAMSVRDIRVNCVAPGWIQTAWASGSPGPYWERRAVDESLLRRWGQPEDVARTIGWLVSPESAFINGQTIVVNGGRRYYPER